MNAWGSHARGLDLLASTYDADLEFWLPQTVEIEKFLVTWNAQGGDKLHSTSLLT